MTKFIHNCEEIKKCVNHFDGWGAAFETIFYSEHLECWFVGNGEYATKVNYCPCCGVKLEVPQSDLKDNEVHPIGKT